MCTKYAGSTCPFSHDPRQIIQSALNRLVRSRPGRGEETGYAMARAMLGDAPERGGRRVHHFMTRGPMDVQIDETRQQRKPCAIEMLIGRFHCCVACSKISNAACLNAQPAALDLTVLGKNLSVEKAFRRHTLSLAQRTALIRLASYKHDILPRHRGRGGDLK